MSFKITFVQVVDSNGTWTAGTYTGFTRIGDTAASLKGYMGDGTNYVMECNFDAAYTNQHIETGTIDLSGYSDLITKSFYFDCIYETFENEGLPKIEILDDDVVHSTINLEESKNLYTNMEERKMQDDCNASHSRPLPTNRITNNTKYQS